MEPSFEQKISSPLGKGNSKAVASSSTSKARENAHQGFLAATAKSWERVFTNYRALPNLETAFSSFKEIYPRYCDTLAIESLRVQEYAHLEESGRVCLDYCGFGLFSYLQQFEDWESASFALSSLSVNLCSHALFGAAKEGTVECYIRKRIMDYLNIQDTDYSMVFTASRGASFRLVADAYPFSTARRLVTMYDYESESLGWLVQRAKEKGAKVSDVSFKWPSLRIVSTKLRKLLIAKGSRRRKRGSAAGLFVFPVQSRVSGAKYSYQWMSLAQQNKWHVLLDASALGPKDMDSLGLSMFKPDFIIASFYKVFGADPSGFGCLFIKNTAMQSVQNQSGAVALGIVRIIPYPNDWSSSESSIENPEEAEGPIIPEDDEDEVTDFEFPKSSQLIQGVPSFSGPMLGFDKFSSPEDGTGGAEHCKEEEDDDSSVCDSTGEVSRSPVFSEDGTENLFCLEVGTSPVGSASRTSLSDDQFSGPFSGPIHNPVYDGHFKSHGPSGLRNPLYEDDGPCNIGPNPKENGDSSIALANGNHDAVTDCVTRVSRLAEEGSVLLPNGNAQDVKAKNFGNSPESKECVPHIQGQILTETNKVADLSNAVGACEHSKNHIQHNEIEITEDLTGVVKAEEIAEEKHKWNQSESAIRRETEGDFRLLGRRDGSRLALGCTFSPLQNSEDMGSFGAGRRSFVSADHAVNSFHCPDGSSDFEENEHEKSDEEVDEQDQSEDRDHEIVCRSLDHADMLGLNKSTLRHRYLINWLVCSLLQLQHPGDGDVKSLVHIYGPQIKYDRGASVAFNLYDCHGKLIHPELVQMLADKNNLSLSIGFLRNLHVSENDPDVHFFEENRKATSKGLSKGRVALRMEVVTAALSILSSFEDVYKLWLFVARFLDAEFVLKELSGSRETVIKLGT
ncbi:hypothetical protein GOP47_0020495 [Adiantum capillus-veneris]|uniref:Molybdenum cofactor sulfurase n=1 Tax=Adiantum capillus-veneris TaxID=13818 RepID=A0A9D4U9T9_ADICA|nr:hypothetical protein GOP47_0020495 [Adiantum capillus-veneris]